LKSLGAWIVGMHSEVVAGWEYFSKLKVINCFMEVVAGGSGVNVL